MQPAKRPSALELALKKREPIRATDTDALRIVDGRGDGFEDLEIDDFAGRWLVQTRSDEFPKWLRDCWCSGASVKRPGEDMPAADTLIFSSQQSPRVLQS